MADTRDPYWKLRPEPPTPEAELCRCADAPPLLLQPHLSANPLCCVACNLEVPPERVGLPERLADQLAGWRVFHDCFYLLWLDSGEFEAWAKAQLEDPASPVNTRGRELVAALGELGPTYYAWFEDAGAEGGEPLRRCPVCEGALVERYARRLCEGCAIAVSG